MLEDWRSRGGDWVIAQLFVLVVVFGLPASIGRGFLPWPATLNAGREPLGLVLLLIGSAMTAIAIGSLGRSLTPFPKPTSAGTLITNGIYRLVRHPIYGGIVILALASGLRGETLIGIPLAALAAVFFDRKASAEEGWLIERFPEYESYRQRTRKLIPFLW